MKVVFMKCFPCAILLCCIFITSHADTVIASTDYSQEKSSTVNGITYHYQSYISTSGSSGDATVTAETCINSYDYGDVPSGYMGIQARLFRNDALYSASDWVYNGSSSSSFQVQTDATAQAGTYYSHGKVQMYNGNGYNTYFAYQTPNVTLRKAGNTFSEDATINKIFEYRKNDNGETYGSALHADLFGKDPDLILAMGENEILGYIRSIDIDKMAPTAQESLYGDNSSSFCHSIPLYDNSGKIVIGHFYIHGNTEKNEK